MAMMELMERDILPCSPQMPTTSMNILQHVDTIDLTDSDLKRPALRGGGGGANRTRGTRENLRITLEQGSIRWWRREEGV